MLVIRQCLNLFSCQTRRGIHQFKFVIHEPAKFSANGQKPQHTLRVLVIILADVIRSLKPLPFPMTLLLAPPSYEFVIKR